MSAPTQKDAGADRILIAEDSPMQAEHLRFILEENGYAVDVASNGREALDAAVAIPPDLVISDVNMPEMDGYDLSRALKSTPALRHIPIMLVTTLSSAHDVVRGLECGADNFITKPYEEAILLTRVRYLLINSALRGESSVRTGIEIDLAGKRHFITAERHQILDLLISTYAEAVRLSEEAILSGQRLRDSYDTMAVLHGSAESLNKVHTEAEVVNVALHRIQELPFCNAAWILLTDDDVIVRNIQHGGLTETQAAMLSATSLCACQRDLRLGKLTEVVQIAECARMRKEPGSQAVIDHVCIPLIGQQRVFGTLNAVANEHRAFTPEELHVLSALGNQVTAAMDRAHLTATLERKVAERTEALRQSRESLTRAQRVGHLGSADLDLANGRITWSDELYRLLGLDPSTVPAALESYLKVIPPEDHAFTRDVGARMRNGLDIEPFEFRILRPDSGERWLYRVTETFRNADGVPTHVSSTFQDITDRKRIEEELRYSLDIMARGQRIGLWGNIDTDLRTGEVRWSDGMYRILGLASGAEEPNFQRILALVHPEDRAMVIRSRDEISRSTGVAANEFRIIRPDGEVRWLQRLAEVIRDEMGEPVRRAVTFHDITARKQMENELLRSREHLAKAQRVGQIGSVDTDMISGKSRWSDEIFRILGLEPGTVETTFERYVESVHPDDRAIVLQNNEDLHSGGSGQPAEYRIVRPSGEVRWVSRLAETERDDQGRPIQLIITIRDITAAKKVEIEREQLEAQLRQSQKMEAIGNLTGGIAHDFNNILAIVIGNLDLLNMEIEAGSEASGLVETAITASLKGSELTKSLLAFSRRQPLQPKSVFVNKLLGDGVKMLSRAIGEHIQVHLKLGEGLGPVLIDPSQLESALLNMMVNARDAMPSGGHIIIETRGATLDDAYVAQNPDAAPGDYVLLEVSDSGTGMPPEVLQRVFEPFFTTKEKGKGTGLGLAMVFGFVKQSGGHIKIYSEVGHGTTIRIYLPIAGDHAGAAQGDKTLSRTAAVSRGETVLVVEDNPAVRKAVAKQLSGAGYQVHQAEAAHAAVAILEGGAPIDLIFSDVIMPGAMTGADLAREVNRRWPGIKVLLTSGFPEGLLENGNKIPSGVNLLSKPYRMEELLHRLRQIIDAQ